MIGYYFALIGFIFAATTLAYFILYRKTMSEVRMEDKLSAVEEIRVDEEKLVKLGEALSKEKLDLEELLRELKEIRRQAEKILDEERGGLEGKGSSDKGGP